MGKYLSPTIEQVIDSKLKCAVIRYYNDDGGFFLNAIRGQLAELGNWYLWEGDRALTDEIVQRFIDAELLTDETFFIKDCGDLLDAIGDDGIMAIEVTVNNSGCGCGCGGSGGSGAGSSKGVNPYPNNTNSPLRPVPAYPQVDDGTTVPDGFDTYEEYRQYKCNVATALVRDFIESVGNFQALSGLAAAGAIGLISGVVGVATVESATVGLIAVGLSAATSAALVMVALIAVIALGAAAFDYFQDIRAELLLDVDGMICEAYEASNPTEFKQVFYDRVDAAVVNLVATDGIKDTFSEVMTDLVDAFIPAELVTVVFSRWTELQYADTDCTECIPSGDVDVFFTFDVGYQAWIGSGAYDGWDATEQALYCVQGGAGNQHFWATWNNTIQPAFGGATPVGGLNLTSISFKGWRNTDFTVGTVTIEIDPSAEVGGPHVITFPVSELPLVKSSVTSFSFDVGIPLTNDVAVKVSVGGYGTNETVFFDDIRLVGSNA